MVQWNKEHNIASCNFCYQTDLSMGNFISVGTISSSLKHLWNQCKQCGRQGHLGHFITIDDDGEQVWDYVDYCVCCKYPKRGSIKSDSVSLDSQVLSKYGKYLLDHCQGAFLFVSQDDVKYIWYEPYDNDQFVKFYRFLFYERHKFIQNEEFYHFYEKHKNSADHTVGNIVSKKTEAGQLLSECKKLKYDLKKVNKFMKKEFGIVKSVKSVKYTCYCNGKVRNKSQMAAPAGLTTFPKLMDQSSADYIYQVQNLLMHKATHDYDFAKKYHLAFHNLFDDNGKLNIGNINKLNYKIFMEYMYNVKDIKKTGDICSNWQTTTIRSPLNSRDFKHYGVKLLTKLVYGYADTMCRVVKPWQKPFFNGYQLMIYNHYNSSSLGLRYHKDNVGILNHGMLVPAVHYHGIGAVSFSTKLENDLLNMKTVKIIDLVNDKSIYSQTGIFKYDKDGYVMSDEVVKFYEHGVVNPSKIGSLANYNAQVAQKQWKLQKLVKLSNGMLAYEDDGLLVPQSGTAVVRTYKFGLVNKLV